MIGSVSEWRQQWNTPLHSFSSSSFTPFHSFSSFEYWQWKEHNWQESMKLFDPLPVLKDSCWGIEAFSHPPVPKKWGNHRPVEPPNSRPKHHLEAKKTIMLEIQWQHVCLTFIYEKAEILQSVGRSRLFSSECKSSSLLPCATTTGTPWLTVETKRQKQQSYLHRLSYALSRCHIVHDVHHYSLCHSSYWKSEETGEHCILFLDIENIIIPESTHKCQLGAFKKLKHNATKATIRNELFQWLNRKKSVKLPFPNSASPSSFLNL